MTSKKLSSHRSLPVQIARILKIAGLVITLAALFDILILSIPYQMGDRQWQIDFVTSIVDRGIVPLVGIVIFLTGYGLDSGLDRGMESALEGRSERRAIWQTPRFWALALSSLLGLVYVLAFPLHLYNVGQSNQAALEEVNEQGEAAETQLSDQVTQEVEARRQQISQLMTANEDQLNQLISGSQLTQEQADKIKAFKAKPDSVEPFLAQQEEELRKQVKTQIELRKKTALEARKTEDLKSGLRIGIGSLLLAIGFITVGWSGLRNLRQQ
ncbi:MAG: HpsJ family protein [Pegethrix bostrychoides GSE-TBD4-15B]|jgi:hypothetical protein|uniref:HpsJ family protein n=1 Tax=Pegethrix bostrychoides GSE-TBD4-15B TaxID=2839662 RepID=A0A951PAW4_9CYAN|nr:HpsJ family protein [Pegethrix bostrychoides GSE-TBD4-15B]